MSAPSSAPPEGWDSAAPAYGWQNKYLYFSRVVQYVCRARVSGNYFTCYLGGGGPGGIPPVD